MLEFSREEYNEIIETILGLCGQKERMESLEFLNLLSVCFITEEIAFIKDIESFLIRMNLMKCGIDDGNLMSTPRITRIDNM